MKKLLLILSVIAVIASCKRQSIEPATPIVQQPLSREERMAAITKMESNMDSQVEKRKNVNSVTSGLINSGALAITGTFTVGHGPVEDTLILQVTDWNGLWHDYFISWAAPITSMLPGGEGLTNYGQYLPQIPTPFQYPVIIAHEGQMRSYFAGVSSDGGFNWAGKTLSNQ